MQKFSLILNPKKCSFGITSGNLLGYIIFAKGIEMDPKTIQDIMEMPPPQNISQMRGVQGRLQSIHWFISQLEDKLQPFTMTMHKGVKYNWNEECDQRLTQIKKYLINPSMVMPPIHGNPIILYISVTDSSLGFLLAQENHKNME